MNVSILGSGKTSEGDWWYELVKVLAKELASQGHTVFHGGVGGNMKAAALGAGEQAQGVLFKLLESFADNIGSVHTVVSEVDSIPGLESFDAGAAIRLHALTAEMDVVVVFDGSGGTAKEVSYSILKKGKDSRRHIFVGDTFRWLVEGYESMGWIGGKYIDWIEHGPDDDISETMEMIMESIEIDR